MLCMCNSMYLCSYYYVYIYINIKYIIIYDAGKGKFY